VEAAIKHDELEACRLLRCYIEGSAVSQLEMERWNGLTRKQCHQICHVG